MSKKLYEEDDIIRAVSKIKEKTGNNAPMRVSDMESRIEEISSTGTQVQIAKGDFVSTINGYGPKINVGFEPDFLVLVPEDEYTENGEKFGNEIIFRNKKDGKTSIGVNYIGEAYGTYAFLGIYVEFGSNYFKESYCFVSEPNGNFNYVAKRFSYIAYKYS